MTESKVRMLTRRVSDPTLAWDQSTLDSKDVIVPLSPQAQKELERSRHTLSLDSHTFEPQSHDLSKYEQLRDDVARIVDTVTSGCGLVVIDGSHMRDFSDLEQRNAHWVISLLAGKPLEQSAKGEYYVTVKDTGQRMANGGRYHQSNEGGELHTDSPQYPSPPELLSMHCLHPAYQGGESLFVSAYTLHNQLLESAPELLSELYNDYQFERRGPGETRPTLAPIFQFEEQLAFRYLGNYVRSGHRQAGQPLTAKQEAALTNLDRHLADAALRLTCKLERGDIVIANNLRVVHGRLGFTDDREGGQPQRELGRAWLAKARGAS